MTEALASFDRALALKPDYAEAHNNRGNALLELNRHRRGAGRLRRARWRRSRTSPTRWSIAAMRCAISAAPTRRWQASSAAHRLDPQMRRGALEQGAARSVARRIRAGFAGYEWRWRRDAERSAARLRAAAMARRGARRQDDPAACRAGLRRHHPDACAMCRWSKARGATRHAGSARRPAAAARDACDGVTRCSARGDALPPFDLHCPLMSLPLAFGTTLDDRSRRRCPICARRPNASRAWRARLPARAPRVGLVWSGKPSHKNDRNRSIPLRAAQAAAGAAGRQLRQPADAKTATADLAGARAVPEPRAARRRAHRFRRYRRGRSQQLDLVIAVDTAVAHLAGALGKPVWRPAALCPGLALALRAAPTAPGTRPPACSGSPHPAIGTARLRRPPGRSPRFNSRQLSARLRYHAGTMASRPKQAEPRPQPRLYLMTPRLSRRGRLRRSAYRGARRRRCRRGAAAPGAGRRARA